MQPPVYLQINRIDFINKNMLGQFLLIMCHPTLFLTFTTQKRKRLQSLDFLFYFEMILFLNTFHNVHNFEWQVILHSDGMKFIGPLSYRGSRKITIVCLFVLLPIWQLVFFSGMDPKFFSDFLTMVDNWNIQELPESYFPRRFIFGQIWAIKLQNGCKIGFFRFFENFCHQFLSGNNLK